METNLKVSLQKFCAKDSQNLVEHVTFILPYFYICMKINYVWQVTTGLKLFDAIYHLANPVAHVSQAFREYLLRYALSSIVLPSATDEDTTGDKSVRDALRYLHMLNECASTSEKPVNMSSAVGDDEVAKWWVAVGMVAVHWLQGEDETAERFYSTIESVPKSLWNAE